MIRRGGGHHLDWEMDELNDYMAERMILLKYVELEVDGGRDDADDRNDKGTQTGGGLGSRGVGSAKPVEEDDRPLLSSDVDFMSGTFDSMCIGSSDCFYNAGWTEDIRKVINYLHCEYPEAPLFAVGTSIGANVLVKYLGEDGDNIPVAGAAAICSPWDLLVSILIDMIKLHTLLPSLQICDRFIRRRLLQKFYDRVLTIGLQGYAQLHQPVFSRLADWEGIKKSRSVRDFDNYATCLVGKYETVDTFYRHCSSTSFVGNVSVPLLCINALDDPVCSREAIPWDECRANKNIILATTWHGGHLAFFEGITASRVWWVNAVDEFLGVLHSSTYMHRQKAQKSGPHCSLESSIDQGPYLNVMEDGMMNAMGSERKTHEIVVEDLSSEQFIHEKKTEDIVSDKDQSENKTEAKIDSMHGIIQPTNQDAQSGQDVEDIHDVTAPVRRCLDQLSRQNRRSMWLLAYIAIITTWPLVGSALLVVFKRKFRTVLPSALSRSL
ncbi:hypothetical protein HHK36_009090 [Tetracentron sinense]|uniref:Uncharacterized protein n=1 Tax=Tetracentron sinense TaxID=13715 RepID=A0A835DKQ3_TETSI|nr:hypothetical protein HHK36_009090 [Tetracentron sinense]